MNTTAASGLTPLILLTAFILIAATAASVLIGNTDEKISYADYNNIINDTIDEISSYLQIKQVYGHYEYQQDEHKIQKITILIKPLFDVNIDLSKMLVQLNTGNQLRILSFQQQADTLDSHTLFQHPQWQKLSPNSFGYISILDSDNSLTNHYLINDNTDMVYISIKLDESISLSKGDTIQITLIPSQGIQKTIQLTAPLPMTEIVDLL